MKWAANFFPGADVGGYRLCRRLHAGAQVELWLASVDDTAPVALKLCRGELRRQAAAARQLRREYSLLTELDHPNILRVRDALPLQAYFGFSAEFLPGGDMVSLAGGHPGAWLEPIRDLLFAIEYLHSLGFVHRDIKARNVMFDADDRVRLIDFGSAAATGTPATLAGTTLEHRRPGAEHGLNRAENDWYAFAVLLYELIHGALPPLPLSGAPACDAGVGGLASLVYATLSTSSRATPPGFVDFGDAIESALAKFQAVR